MKCPSCSHLESRVLDSRTSADGTNIKRRRECLNCQKRFTTFETIETRAVMVIKKDKTRELFDREKLVRGMIKACEKRPVSLSQIEKSVSEIESTIQNSMNGEVASTEIGELVMDKLKSLDDVAYVRFASVYRQFKDINTFMDEIKKILGEKKDI